MLCYYGTENPIEGRELCDKYMKEMSPAEKTVLWQDRATFFFDSALDLDDAVYSANEGLKLDPNNKYLMWKKVGKVLGKRVISRERHC